MKKGNILKGWVTSIIGTVTMLVTLILVINKTFDFVWEGIGGLVIGCILLLAPETIETKVSAIIDKWSSKSSSSSTDV